MFRKKDAIRQFVNVITLAKPCYILEECLIKCSKALIATYNNGDIETLFIDDLDPTYSISSEDERAIMDFNNENDLDMIVERYVDIYANPDAVLKRDLKRYNIEYSVADTLFLKLEKLIKKQK